MRRKKRIAPSKPEETDEHFDRLVNTLIKKWNDETKFGDVTG